MVLCVYAGNQNLNLKGHEAIVNHMYEHKLFTDTSNYPENLTAFGIQPKQILEFTKIRETGGNPNNRTCPITFLIVKLPELRTMESMLRCI